jgi:vancomycin resistance protein YoaR
MLEIAYNQNMLPQMSAQEQKSSSSTIAIKMILVSAGFYFAILIVFLLGYQLWFLGRIFPGVTIGGVDVGGLSIAAASQKISELFRYPETGQIALHFDDQSWVVTPNQIGFFLDPQSSAKAAYLVGRKGSLLALLAEQLGTWRYGRDVSLAVIFDERTALQNLDRFASTIDIAPVEASIILDGTNIRINSGQVGQQVDRYSTLAAIGRQVQSMQDGSIEMVVSDVAPNIMDVSAQAETVRRLLSQPFSLTLPPNQPDPIGPWQFEPSTWAGLLEFEKLVHEGKLSISVQMNEPALRAYLANLASTVFLDPKNPRFIFNDTTKLLDLKTPALIGRRLNIDNSIQAVQQAITNGQSSAELVFDYSNPPVTDDMTGAQLDITELIHQEISYFTGSNSDRAQNIAIASDRFLGLLVAPGEEFSMAKALGDISLDNGYTEALIIYGDRTIKGVGGGVCQVSTTLFRAAFFTGFPILERHAHAYRVSYYELTAYGRDPSLAGLDATVYFPLVDLKFKNDSPYWLLMEVYVSKVHQTITWKFYSTSDGRTVEWNSTGLTNVVPAPQDVYRENPELQKDEIKQVEWKADGAFVRVNRTVTKDGAIYFQDLFSTQYEPWGAVYEYGPGTAIPSP